MKINQLFIIFGIILSGCVSDVVEKEPKAKPESNETNKGEGKILDQDLKSVKEQTLSDGLKIKWFEVGTGEKISYGDMLAIDYKVQLSNGEVIDGNHLLSKASVPFIVGFNLQTKGWELALSSMRIGDFAEIFIPSKLARGEQAVEGLFPANSDNVLRIRIIKKIKPTRVVDGTKVWLIEENPAHRLAFGEKQRITFHCMAFTPSNPLFINTYRNDEPFSMKLEDHGLVPGLKKALINAKKSDRLLVFVPSEQAYQSKGYLDVVKPNEDIFYNVLVMNVIDN